MDLFCRLFNILNFYAVLAQNTLQFCAQQRIIPHRHVPCQHCLARIPKAEINFYRAPVKNVAEQIFHLMHLRAIPRRHRQEIAGGPSPARLAAGESKQD